MSMYRQVAILTILMNILLSSKVVRPEYATGNIVRFEIVSYTNLIEYKMIYLTGENERCVLAIFVDSVSLKD